MKRIHIVGSNSRSGTTLMAELMVSSFLIDLYSPHERRIHKWPPSSAISANIFLTKKPRDILVVEPLIKIMPNLYVIYLVRDPRDSVVSIHGKDPNRYWTNLGFWKIYFPYAQKLKAHPRFIVVRYEDLVTNPDQIQNYLMERMPFLIKKASFSEYHLWANPSRDSMLALKGVRPLETGSIGNWRKHLPRLAGQIKIHGSISQDLIHYGYEQDNSWEKELEGIEPDLEPSHWPEDAAQKRLRHWMRGRWIKAFWVKFGHNPLVLKARSIFSRNPELSKNFLFFILGKVIYLITSPLTSSLFTEVI